MIFYCCVQNLYIAYQYFFSIKTGSFAFIAEDILTSVFSTNSEQDYNISCCSENLQAYNFGLVHVPRS